MTIQQAYASRRPAEVDFPATVTGSPHFFYGTRTHAEHEEFPAQTPAGPVDVIDNVNIAPRVPVQPGSAIEVRGEMVHDPGKEPVVHWTHHDPQGTHADGYIRFNGKLYA